jgi:hypothetical protein
MEPLSNDRSATGMGFSIEQNRSFRDRNSIEVVGNTSMVVVTAAVIEEKIIMSFRAKKFFAADNNCE